MPLGIQTFSSDIQLYNYMTKQHECPTHPPNKKRLKFFF